MEVKMPELSRHFRESHSYRGIPGHNILKKYQMFLNMLLALYHLPHFGSTEEGHRHLTVSVGAAFSWLLCFRQVIFSPMQRAWHRWLRCRGVRDLNAYLEAALTPSSGEQPCKNTDCRRRCSVWLCRLCCTRRSGGKGKGRGRGEGVLPSSLGSVRV